MKGVAFDINVQGHRSYLLHLVAALGLRAFWDELNAPVVTIPGLGYSFDTPDRIIWNRCQDDELVLVTENRNDDGPDSLDRTISDSLTAASLPVLTLANKPRFERDRRYALIVAESFLEGLLDARAGTNRGIGRVYIPPHAVS